MKAGRRRSESAGHSSRCAGSLQDHLAGISMTRFSRRRFPGSRRDYRADVIITIIIVRFIHSLHLRHQQGNSESIFSGSAHVHPRLQLFPLHLSGVKPARRPSPAAWMAFIPLQMSPWRFDESTDLHVNQFSLFLTFQMYKLRWDKLADIMKYLHFFKFWIMGTVSV